MDKALEQILKIDNNNNFLKYIVERVQRDDYRGIQISQHNRYTLDVVKIMFEEIYKISKDNFFSIPSGDCSKTEEIKEARLRNPEFALMTDNIYKRLGRTTMNSLKKNFFVDFARSGFIDRFNKNKEKLHPHKRSNVYYSKLSESAIKLAKSTDIKEQYFIFSRQIDTLFGVHISELAEAIYYSNYKNTSIFFTEFQYILSDLTLDRGTKIKLLDAYRSIELFKRNRIDELLKKYCNPKNFKHNNKTVKKDFWNWQNETKQIMYLLKNTIYFDVRQSSFALNRGMYGIFPEKPTKDRSLAVKQEYYEKHNIVKKENFELHHIVPISYAKNRTEFALIDNFQNLIYIKDVSHRKIKKTDILLSIQNPSVEFKNINTKEYSVIVKNGEDAFYNIEFSCGMEKYNRNLLKTVLEFE